MRDEIDISVGKIMAFYSEPQWAVVGDTFVVGCRPQPSIVYYDTSFNGNPDVRNPAYKSDIGRFSNMLEYLVKFSFQHRAGHLRGWVWPEKRPHVLGP